jgi:hypothetical protein
MLLCFCVSIYQSARKPDCRPPRRFDLIIRAGPLSRNSFRWFPKSTLYVKHSTSALLPHRPQTRAVGRTKPQLDDIMKLTFSK